MTAPFISVIINNYNYAEFLNRAIQSALDQRGVAFEVIVVDDGSTDASRAIIEEFGDLITPVFQPNAGQAAAINTGVQHSRGEILCFLDADDWFVAGKLAAVLVAFTANPKAGLVYHRLQPILQDGRDAFKAIPRSQANGDLAPMMARTGGRWSFPMTSAVSVPRSLWQRVGDIPTSLRISADAWLVGIYPFMADVVALPHVFGFYRIHNNNWYRAQDDAVMLLKRMDHWQSTITFTNIFLRAEGMDWRVHLADHHPFNLAHARLNGATPKERMQLFIAGLSDHAEPNIMRRTRDALRAFNDLSSSGMATALTAKSL